MLYATFLYVFNDFLNVQINGLSPLMRERCAEFGDVMVLATAAVLAGRSWREARLSSQSVGAMAASLGEISCVRAVYGILWQCTVTALLHGLSWTIVWKYLARPELAVSLTSEAAMLAASAVIWRWPALRSAAPIAIVTRPIAASGTPVRTLLNWRLRQFSRSRLTRLCVLLSLGFSALIALAAYRQAPPFVAVLAGMASGYLVAAALCLQLGDDMQTVWTERGFGVSHSQFVEAYQKLGLLLGLATGVFAVFLDIACASLGGMSGIDTAAKLLVITALPAAATPWLMLQIDARRPMINLVVTLIVTLFIGTAIFAHWLGLLLVPLVRYYGLEKQAGRFYRA